MGTRFASWTVAALSHELPALSRGRLTAIIHSTVIG